MESKQFNIEADQLKQLVAFAKTADILYRRKLVITLRTAGLSVIDISREMGVSRGFIYKWIERNKTTGLETLPRSGRPKKPVNTAFENSVNEAAKEQGVHPSTLYRELKRHG